MKKIASFEVDHTTLEKGMYISRIDGDAVTYDLRMKRPNVEEVIDNSSIHTLEHLFATFVRNSPLADGIIYFGPMGCRTGFYFIVRDKISHAQAVELSAEAFEFISRFAGEIPGVSEIECGNYKEHSLEGAKNEARLYADILKNWSAEKLEY